jgi:hypothetical protein
MHLVSGADYWTKVQHGRGRALRSKRTERKRVVNGPRGSGLQFDQAIPEFLQLSSEMRNVE